MPKGKISRFWGNSGKGFFVKNYTLYLVRHGITRANLDGIYAGGGTDFPLCSEGKEDLQSLRRQFSYPDVGTVFVSPLQRATQTADILFPDAKKLVIENLRENHFGEFEGRSMAELKTDPNFQKWLDPQQKYQPKGAEDNQQFHHRCAETLMKMFEYMMKADISEAACVTHGGVIMSMLAQKALPTRPPEQWITDPGCGYQLQTSVAMWMRDNLAEAVRIVPFGYME